MTRRNRRPNWRRIKSLRTYTIDEAASALQVHRNTIRHWIKKSELSAFTDQRPHLIHGSNLVAFLKARREAKRQRCGRGQLFCLKCRLPQAPAAGMLDYEQITPSRGMLVGICPACNSLMRRFVSRCDRPDDSPTYVQSGQQEGSLKDTAMPSLGCDLNDETEHA